MTTKMTRETRQNEINNIARTLKYTSMADHKRSALRDKLTLLVLEDKGLASCVTFKTEDALVEENQRFQYFDNKVFAEALHFAERDFGKVDKNSGKEIPFMQLFNFAWNLKGGDIHLHKNAENNGFNRDRKKFLMEFFLEECCKHSGKRRTERFNVLQIDKVEKWLLDNGFGEAEQEKARSILENSYVVNDEIATVDEEQSGCRLSDTTSFTEYGCSERSLDSITAKAMQAYEAAGKKNFEKMRYLLTLNYMAFEGKIGQLCELYMEDLFDEELADFVRQQGYPEDNAGTLAEYLGVKRETARKTLREMQKILEKLNKKEMR